MKRAAIYCRVSTADQRIESQLYQLRELAAARGFEVVQEYIDRGFSVSKLDRPGLDPSWRQPGVGSSMSSSSQRSTASPEAHGIFGTAR